MRVLLVPSQRACLEPEARVLRDDGFEADFAADEEAVLKLLSAGYYQVVVLDLMEASGAWRLLEAAVSAEPPSRVVALADHAADPAIRRMAYGAGVWDLVEMPRQEREDPLEPLLAAVRRAQGAPGVPSVLLVDNCRELAAGIGGLLEEEGYRVDTVATAGEAIGRMQGRSYSLIVTETRNPGPDGFRLLKESSRLGPDVPIVVLTAARDDATFIKAVELGARACLWKLSEPEEIVRELKMAVESAGQTHGSTRT
ncbi:MAG TPA: response regulator [Candidatus Polarisedimenticolia bacterium]|nr:response regulator [Candidatus Polarisedimenticolia bacterium]